MESIIFIAFIALIAYFVWAVNRGEFYPHSMTLFACGMFIMIGINCCSSALALFLPNREELNAIYNSNRLNECIENNDSIKENLKNKKDSIIWIKTICPKCYYKFEFYKMKSKLYDD